MKIIEILKKIGDTLVKLDEYADRLLNNNGQVKRYPEHYVVEGLMGGNTKYCIDDGKIYEGALPGNCVGCIDEYGRIYKSPYPDGSPIANIGEDGRIYEGAFPGICLGSIVNGVVTLDGNYFPTGPADYTIF